MQHIGRLAAAAGALAALTVPAAALAGGIPRTAPPQKSLSMILVNGPRMGGGGGGFRGGGGMGGAALGGAIGGLLGAMASQPQAAPVPYYSPPPYQPPPVDYSPPYYQPPVSYQPPPQQYVDQPPPTPQDTYVTVPVGNTVSIGRTRPPMISPQRMAPPDDPTMAWADPGQIISLLAPPSGGPAPPLLDQPPPGSPLARNPKLLQATLDSYDANLTASGWADAYTVANGTDWVGWTAQTGLTYVPGMKPVNTSLTVARGFASNFGTAMADPNVTWGQTFARGATGGFVAGTTTVLVPGVGKGDANGLPTEGGVIMNTVKRLISKGMGTLTNKAYEETQQQGGN